MVRLLYTDIDDAMVMRLAQCLGIITAAFAWYGVALVCGWGIMQEFRLPNSTQEAVMTFVMLPFTIGFLLSVLVIIGLFAILSVILDGVCAIIERVCVTPTEKE